MTETQDGYNPFPETGDETNGYQMPAEDSNQEQSDTYEQTTPYVQQTSNVQQNQSTTDVSATSQPVSAEQPATGDQQATADSGNAEDNKDWKEKANEGLTKTESGMNSVLEKTDDAVGKPFVGFTEKVGAAFKKWFNLA